MNLKHVLYTAMLIFMTNLSAEDRIQLDKIDIQGANELPKVLYIVPWKRTVVDTSPVEVDSMIDEVMTPIDREVLRRQVDYYEKGVFGQ